VEAALAAGAAARDGVATSGRRTARRSTASGARLAAAMAGRGEEERAGGRSGVGARGAAWSFSSPFLCLEGW